jgi:sedoheptulose-bisphosphatase
MPSGNLNLTAHLESLYPPDIRTSLRSDVIPALIKAVYQIAEALRKSDTVSQVGTANAFGDEQLNVDVLAEKIIRTAIAKCRSIRTASSEEDPEERPLRLADEEISQSGTEQYTVAFDPLDGSSIIAPNWTVGTIIGIWDGATALHQNPKDKLVAAIMSSSQRFNFKVRPSRLLISRPPTSAPLPNTRIT